MPTTRTSGRPFDPALATVEVSLSADEGANFGVLGTVPPGAAPTFTQTELEDAYWVFRFVVIDDKGLRSSNFDFGIDTSPPGVVFNVNFTLG